MPVSNEMSNEASDDRQPNNTIDSRVRKSSPALCDRPVIRNSENVIQTTSKNNEEEKKVPAITQRTQLKQNKNISNNGSLRAVIIIMHGMEKIFA